MCLDASGPHQADHVNGAQVVSVLTAALACPVLTDKAITPTTSQTEIVLPTVLPLPQGELLLYV